jgi:hypothetical protein
VDTYTGWGMAFTELNYGFQEDFRKELFLRQTLRQLPTLIMSYQDSGVVRWLEGNDQLAQLWGLQSGRNLSAVFSKIQQAHLMSVFSGHQQSQSFVVEDKVFHVYVSPHLPQTGLAFFTQMLQASTPSSAMVNELHIFGQNFARLQCLTGKLEDIGGLLALLQSCSQIYLFGRIECNTGKIYTEGDKIVCWIPEAVCGITTLEQMIESATGDFCFIPKYRAKQKNAHISIQNLALEQVFPLRGVRFDHSPQGLHDHFHSVHLPSVFALKAFLCGVGGSVHFQYVQEFDAATNGERVVLYGRGFRVVIGQITPAELKELGVEQLQKIKQKNTVQRKV